MSDLPTGDRQQAYLALRSTLHALRDRLSVEEATDLGAQFPALIRGFYYEGWNPSGKPEDFVTAEEFLDRVEEGLPRGTDLDARRVAEVVFQLLNDRITRGEVEDVRGMLSKKIRTLWPAPESTTS